MKVRAICIIANLLLIAAMGFEQYSAAQVNTASLHGTVTDSTGAVIPSADVTVLNTSTGVSSKTKSDAKGYFAAVSLQPGGPYTVTVSAAGFSAFSSNGLTLNVNDDQHRRQASGRRHSADGSGAGEQRPGGDVGDAAQNRHPRLRSHAVARTRPRCISAEKTAPGVMESSDRFGSFLPTEPIPPKVITCSTARM